MELKDYTFEEIKKEYRRRIQEQKVQKAEEMKNALRCRNCIHITPKEVYPNVFFYYCAVRTWGKKYVRHYTVKPHTKGCNKFERRMI